MKQISTLLLTIIVCLGAYSQTSSDSLVQVAIISDGLFFDRSVPAGSVMPGGSTIVLLKDPEGEAVLGVYLPDGYYLDESIVAKAIPAHNVRFAEKLLRDYNDRKPQTTTAYRGIGVSVGEPMVPFEYSDIDGNLWNNEKLKGSVDVINIWQSECGPCRREMPVLSEWKQRFPDVVFLSASRHDKAEILPVVTRHNFSWTHLQQASELVALTRDEGFPLTIVVDQKGIVRFAKVGATDQNQTQALTTISELLP